jgi:soluble lytic murein transglycosylase-like protein
LAALTIAAGSTHAAIWGYVDEQGQTHVANERLDARYQLFYAGKSTADLARDAAAPDADNAAFQRSPQYLRAMHSANRTRCAPLIQKSAKAAGVDPLLVEALIAAESAFDPAVVSDKGAVGLMQLLPTTAARFGLAATPRQTVEQQLQDPATNLRIGMLYLQALFALYPGQPMLVIAAWNAGEQAVQRNGNQVPPFAETVAFVGTVQRFMYALQPAQPTPPPARIAVPPRARPR